MQLGEIVVGSCSPFSSKNTNEEDDSFPFFFGFTPKDLRCILNELDIGRFLFPIRKPEQCSGRLT